MVQSDGAASGWNGISFWAPRLAVVLVVGALLALVFAGGGVVAFEAAGPRLADLAPSGPLRDASSVLADAVVIGGLALGFALAAALAFKRPLRSFVTTARRFRWPLLAAGFVPFALIQLAVLGATVGFQAEHGAFVAYPSALEALTFCLAALVFYAPSVLAEEVLFRGWILTGDTTASRRNLLLVLASSLAFCLAHLQSNAAVMALHFVSGAAYGWAAVRLGGLEFSLGAHLAKNTMLAALIGLPGQHRWGDAFPLVVGANIAAAVVLAGVAEVVRRRLAPRAGRGA